MPHVTKEPDEHGAVRWLWHGSYDDRHYPQEAGWRWDPPCRVWWTERIDRAASLAEFASGSVREELENHTNSAQTETVYLYEWIEGGKIVMGYVDKRSQVPKGAQRIGRSDLNGAALQMMVREKRLEATGYVRTRNDYDFQVWEKHKGDTDNG